MDFVAYFCIQMGGGLMSICAGDELGVMVGVDFREGDLAMDVF